MVNDSVSPSGRSHESDEHNPHSNIRDQERFLPITNISRIMEKGPPCQWKNR
ncbi:hypothetical protein SESBI_47376 [Sesbania bispinosa]|nr:hypothetical protein SESBI_47376 [Sesbania bispinosa]